MSQQHRQGWLRIRRTPNFSVGLSAVLQLSFVQWVAGLAALATFAVQSMAAESTGAVIVALGPLVAAASATSFGVMGIALLVGQRNDRRASLLGAVLLLSASSFAMMPLITVAREAQGAGWSGPGGVARLLAAVGKMAANFHSK